MKKVMLVSGTLFCLSLSSFGEFSAEDEKFLEDLSRRSFSYFVEYSNPETGLVSDRGLCIQRSNHYPQNASNIAATGFGLTALCIGAERGWIEKDKALNMTKTSLRFFAKRAPNVKGWFYHWMEEGTGERVLGSEVSTIDTALLLAGILTAKKYWNTDEEIQTLAKEIYERIDFTWMMHLETGLLYHGWRPESGFINHVWDQYSESLILYLLAIGSPTHPIPKECWYKWQVEEPELYGPFRYIGKAPIFTYQFPHAWIDFRGLKDKDGLGTDWFENSKQATWAHRQYCIDISHDFPGCYSEDIWGITPSDGLYPNGMPGYISWHGPRYPYAPIYPLINGTVVPCAPAGSMMFEPELCLKAIKEMKRKHGTLIYGRYGFADAFHPVSGWVSPYVIGIDVGITFLSTENARTGNVWKWFMKNEEVAKAMEKVGFKASVSDTASE
jgi:hypothetical protein